MVCTDRADSPLTLPSPPLEARPVRSLCDRTPAGGSTRSQSEPDRSRQLRLAPTQARRAAIV